MTISFTMVGKIAPIKANDKFLPYEERVTKSGWKMRTLNFNCNSGNNRHLLRVNGVCKKDESNDIFCTSIKNEDGKSETLRIPFKERLTSPDVKRVANFKLLTIDLEEPGRRNALRQATETIKNSGTISDEELFKLGLKEATDVKGAYETSLKKRKDYISEWDFANDLNKILSSEKFANRKFRIRGVHEFQYNEDMSKVYEHFVPQKIYLAADDVEETSTETVTCYFNKSSLVDNTEAQGKMYMNTKVFMYDKRFKEEKCKGQIPIDYQFTFKSPKALTDDIEKRRYSKYIDFFTPEDEDKWYETNIMCNLVNGSETSSITYDDLDDDIKDDIDLGIVDFNDVVREMGGVTYGDRIKEAQLKGFARKSARIHVQETAYDDSFFKLPTDKEEDISAEDDGLTVDFDDEDDIFGDLL